jgi:decaprenylphospho-beta-D-erythro-pentofuranosid-2-ulose 2-reductase
MNNKKRIVIIGATSAIAEHCARLWLEKQPADLTLVGRDRQRIERVAKDLKIRSPLSDIQVIQSEFMNAEAINATVLHIFNSPPVDIVLIAHGSLPDQTECQNDLLACNYALEINGVSPVLFAEACAKEMAKVNHGTIALIGSVAGDRGRKSNYVYGAAKGLVTRYAQGLQHRFFNTKIKIVLIKPGPTHTPMTAHLKDSGVSLADVAYVAKEIVIGIDIGNPVVYTPKKWSIIMAIVRHIPRFLFNRINF